MFRAGGNHLFASAFTDKLFERRRLSTMPSFDHRRLTGLTPFQLDLVEKVRQGRRLTKQELPSSYLHTAEEVLARRRLIRGVRTPPTLASLLREIEDASC